MKTYEVTISRVLHEVREVRAVDEQEAMTKAFLLDDNDHETELAQAIALIEQQNEDEYFDASEEILETLGRLARARTLDVTVESVELKGDPQIIVKDNGFAHPRGLKDMEIPKPKEDK